MATLEDFADATVDQIIALNDEDEGQAAPTKYACAKAITLVYETNSNLSGRLPEAFVSPGPNRDIFIYWKKKDRMIQLHVSAQSDGSHSIYVRIGDISYNIEKADSKKLTTCLHDSQFDKQLESTDRKKNS